MLFGILEWSLIVAAICLSEIGVALERRDSAGPKWVIAASLLIAVLVYAQLEQHQDIFSLAFWLSLSLWVYVGKYLSIGIVYSMVEFFYAARKARRDYKDAWETHRKNCDSSMLLERVYKSFNPSFAVERGTNSIFKVSPKTCGIEVGIRKDAFSEYVAAWTFLWPMYVIDFVLGRVLDEFWHWVSNIADKLANKYIKFLFRNIFQ